MGLNSVKQGSNMYEFITNTWNTIKGKCFHDCSYCYCKSIAKRFNAEQKPVHFDEKELKTNLGSGKFIFIGSSCDMFAENIPDEWINKTLEHCQKFDNKYLFQTKNPKRILNFKLPKSVICTTIESDMFYSEIMANSPKPYDRAKYMKMLSDCGFETFVTIEPIMDFNLKSMVDLIKQCNPEQVNIGADSGRNNLPEPSKSKVLQLVSELQKFTTIHRKKNLARLL
jgi:DNA repair photolyase